MKDSSFLDENPEREPHGTSGRAHRLSWRDARRRVVVHCAPVERGERATAVREHRTIPGDDHSTLRATLEVG